MFRKAALFCVTTVAILTLAVTGRVKVGHSGAG